MRILLILAVGLHLANCGSLVTIQHYNQPAGITYESGFVPIGSRAGPAITSPSHQASREANQQNRAFLNRNQEPSQRLVAPGAEGFLPPFYSPKQSSQTIDRASVVRQIQINSSDYL